MQWNLVLLTEQTIAGSKLSHGQVLRLNSHITILIGVVILL